MQGFRKVDPDRCEFAKEGFLRGQKHLLKNINRKKPSNAHNQAQQSHPQSASIAACVEVGKFGLEEEIDRLKRDKNVLMQELIKLRQKQQSTDNQLQMLGKHLQEMERRQQLMMSFLAKTLQSPRLFAQLVQHNENNRRVGGANKKRRLLKQESGGLEEKSSAPDGQVVKYQPLMNDYKTATLAKVFNFDSPQRLEEPLNNTNGPLVDNIPLALEAPSGRSSLDQNSGVIRAEVPRDSQVPPLIAASSGFSSAYSPLALSDEIADTSIDDVMRDINMLYAAPGAIPCEYPGIQEIVPDGIAGDIPIENIVAAETNNLHLNQIPPIGVDGCQPTEEANADDDQRLSDIMGFLDDLNVPSPQCGGEAEDVVLAFQEAIERRQPAAETGIKCESLRNMDNLMVQMELLASDSLG